MILILENRKQLRGDAIVSAVLRSDLSPIPLTLEADIRSGEEEIDRLIQEGKTLTIASGEAFQIVKCQKVSSPAVAFDRQNAGFRVTAMLAACLPVAYVRQRAIIKENASLAGIYRSAGASIRGVIDDFPVARFCCPVGETPTFHIARILQEAGGAVRWKNGKLRFFSLQAMLMQEPSREISVSGQDSVETGFLERHTVPWFFSVAPNGSVIFGNRDKARKALFSPHKNVQALRNLTRCLVHKKTVKIEYDSRIAAGDAVRLLDGQTYAVITAAHVFESGSDTGQKQNAYTKLWLGQIEE